MTTSFLLEIGTQELPAIPLLAEIPNIKQKLSKILQNHRLLCDFDFYYTPRRLVIIANQFPTSQSPQVLEFFGPPTTIAYKDGNPTQAALSFFKKCGITQEEASTITKDNKEILYFKKESPKAPAQDLLQTITKEFLESLNFGKTMRWGDQKESFIRPISWILCLLNNTPISLNLYGVISQNQTFIHRNISFAPQEVTSIDNYFEILKRGMVILNQEDRRTKILQEIQEIQSQKNIKVEIDENLLEEIVCITEYPTALFGEFSERFLELPAPCIITSMKVNQRYFATYKDKNLYNGFIVVSNSLAQDSNAIIQGNIKVLRARLEDALFFYHNDLKNGFMPEKLKNVTFVEGLGSMWDKTQRERQIIKLIAPLFTKNLEKENQDIGLTLEILDQASMFSKADLMSEMVYEFTELQGIMGYYYVNALGYDSKVALAIKEQYLPNSEESPLPSNLISAFVALAYKLDNLFALFSIHKIPSGSRDPFALRRAAIGIIKIILHFDLSFDLQKISSLLSPLYKPFDLQQLENFILERMDSMFDYNPSLLRAILATNEKNILQIYQKLDALNSVLKNADKNLLMQTFKRVANITKEVNLSSSLAIKQDKLLATEEIELHKAFCLYEEKSPTLNYQEQLQMLLDLNPLLSRFFDKVLVNAPDEDFRNNRKNLIAKIYQAFLNIADIREISF